MFLAFAAAIIFIAPPGVDTIRLPQATPGGEVDIRKVNNTNPLFIVPAAGDTLEGLPSQYILSGANDRIIIVCQTRASWWAVGGFNLPISLTTDVSGVLPVGNGGTGVSVAGDDTILVGDGALWVPKTIPNTFGTGMVPGYRQGLNTINAEPVAQTVRDEAISLTQRPTINMTGLLVTCIDNAGTSTTDCAFNMPIYSKLPSQAGLPKPECNAVLRKNWRGNNCR